MQAVDPKTLTGDLALMRPDTIPVLERHGIDYCCGGNRPLADAARQANTDLDALLAELETIEARPAPRDWRAEPIPALLDFILETHHTYTRKALEALGPMMEKVARIHGERHPEVLQLKPVLDGLLMELGLHLRKEEEILFPMIRALAGGSSASGGCGMGPEGPMQVMEHEHESAGAALRRMRSLTDGYRLPEDACMTFRALYSGIQELEEDLHRHIHLENHVLHPRVRELTA